MPPPSTDVLLATPDDTYCWPPTETTVPLAVPPLKISSNDPLLTTVPLAWPPNTNSKPLDTTTPVAEPVERRTIWPPSSIARPTMRPEASTTPPDITVFEMIEPDDASCSAPAMTIVFEVVPPDATCWKTPVSIVVLVVTPPVSTTSRPELIRALTALPNISCVPPVATVPKAVPLTISVPPVRISVVYQVCPSGTVRFWPLLTIWIVSISVPPWPSASARNVTLL